MTPTHRFNASPAPRRRARLFVLLSALLVLAACSRNKELESDADFRPEPVQIHVRNENFLDMNVAAVAGGVTRRLGMVTGNSSADFTVPWSLGNGTGIILTATPIGGTGRAVTPSLNIGIGQAIDFKVASVLRQSIAVVYEPN
jgi:hypothetical protein